MKAMRAVRQQDVPWGPTKWWKRGFDVGARAEILARLFKEQSRGKTSGGTLGQFARFCLVGASNAVIDFGLLNAALGANVLKLGAILGALALSFFGMRCWVFIGRRLSSGPPATARGLPSSSQDRASKDHRVQESMSVTSLKQSMEV